MLKNSEMSKFGRFGEIVYHVAHPEIAAVIVDKRTTADDYINVIFLKAIEFPGNPRGLANDWMCSIHLMFPTMKEAKDAAE